MTKQHTVPVLIGGKDRQTRSLERVPLWADDSASVRYGEKMIQDLLFDHPDLIPVAEIEPALSPLLPVCTELPTNAGAVDNLFVMPSGHLALAECKLWRNPEARRQALAQAMDYAQAVAKMSYDEMRSAISNAERSADSTDLWSIVSPYSELEEHEFRDALRRNMRTGRVLLLIVGDGIREESEALAEFLQAHAGLHFSLSMIELALYRLPYAEDMLVQPRVLSRTVTIERGIVRVEDERVAVEPVPQEVRGGTGQRPSNLTEEEFYERLAAYDDTLPDRLRQFLDRLEPLGVVPDVRRSLILRWRASDGTGLNLGSVFPDKGEVWTDMIHHHGSVIGAEDLTEAYVRELASATNGRVRNISTTGRPWVTNRDGTPIKLSTLLDVQDQWMAAVEALTEGINERLESKS